MGRPKNTVSTIQLTISTTKITKAFLETLVTHGTYGKNAAEAAERLMSLKLNELRNGGGLIAASLDETWQQREK